MLNNLYGVDIMEEATKVCKLRLFLKLASQITPNPNAQNYGIEPLPDIAIGKDLFAQILRDCDLTVNEFLDLL